MWFTGSLSKPTVSTTIASLYKCNPRQYAVGMLLITVLTTEMIEFMEGILFYRRKVCFMTFMTFIMYDLNMPL